MGIFFFWNIMGRIPDSVCGHGLRLRWFMDIYGYLWIFMDIYGYLWIFMDIYGYLWCIIESIHQSITTDVGSSKKAHDISKRFRVEPLRRVWNVWSPRQPRSYRKSGRVYRRILFHEKYQRYFLGIIPKRPSFLIQEKKPSWHILCPFRIA